MPFTTYLDTKLVSLLFSNTTYSIPTTYYVALFSTAPTQAGGGTELTGGSYARVAVTNNTTNFVASGSQPASGYQMVNGTAIQFPTATANWSTAVAAGIYDASSGGNLLAYGTLSPTISVTSGSTASFAIGALTFTNN